MLAALTGTGLALSAGLNAFIPLVTMGLIARFTESMVLPPGWEWLSNGWVLTLFIFLLILDTLGDKIPAVDHILDIFHTAIRPASGGVVFSAGFGSRTVAIGDPSAITGPEAFGIFLAGLLLALAVHVTKALLRGVINLTTAGIGGPIVSTAEDTASLALSVSAALVPIGVVVVILGIFLSVGWARRHQRRALRLQVGQSIDHPRRFDP